jgi:hypothetical protein
VDERPFDKSEPKCYHIFRGAEAPIPPFMASKPPFAQGAQIEHAKYGLGSVLSCTEEYIVIKFDDHGEKKFVTNLVMGSLKKSDRQPPAEKRGARRKKAVPAAV